MSRTVKDLVAGSALAFTDRGIHQLKGIPEEWQIFAVEVKAQERGALEPLSRRTRSRARHSPGTTDDLRTWLETMNDLRTALLKDPLPLEVTKELLSEAA